MNIPIVVIGYNRADSLQRLLRSVSRARYPGRVDIIISIDHDHHEAVRDVARNFAWDHGEKHLIFHPENLGLRQHVLSCGDLVKECDALIMLEDDLFVSPSFYEFASAAVSYYLDDESIAGISLYSHHFSETAYLPFTPLADRSDVYFMQIPSSWGQVWTASQWGKFRQWYDHQAGNFDPNKANVPDNIRNWRASSWKKYFSYYMIETGRYFVYPRISLTTNFSEPGTHIVEEKSIFQRPLLHEPKPFVFVSPDQTCAVYDAFCEIIPEKLKLLAPPLTKYDMEVDLYGSKALHAIKTRFLLSCKPCRSPVRTFGRAMKPHEVNIIEQIRGDVFALGETGSFRQNKVRRFHSRDLRYYYDLTEYLHFRDVIREIRFRPFKFFIQYEKSMIREHKFRLPFVMLRQLWKRIAGKT